MKIIYLNVWNARQRSEITEYLVANIPTTDVFCMQEVYGEARLLFADVLTDYTAISASKLVTETDNFHQTMYVKNGIDAVSSGVILEGQADCGLGQYIEVKSGADSLFICNFHGMSRPVDKLDCPSRLTQSRALIEFFKDKESVIIGGDFNALPNAQHMQMFARAGYRDLIAEYHVATTRNHLAWDRFPIKQLYSDYVFVSLGVRVNEFLVPDNIASDHLPLEVVVEGCYSVTSAGTQAAAN